MQVETIDIERSIAWSSPKTVQTKRGERVLRKARADDAFWALWRSAKPKLQAMGVSCSKDPQSGTWEACWWQDVSAEVKAERAEAAVKSRLAETDRTFPSPDGLEYLPYQRAGIDYILSCFARGNGCLLGDEMGLGKEQPIDALVLTPEGWKEIGGIKVGDRVIGSHGRPVNVTGVFPQGLKASYCVTFSDGSTVEAGDDHLWTVRYRRGGREWSEITLSTSQLRQRPMIGNLDLSKTVLYLPMLSAPVEFDARQDKAIDPYVMGLLIANGYLKGCSASLSCHAHDLDHIKSKLGTMCGASNTYGLASRINVIGAIGDVRKLGLDVPSSMKFIPRSYLMSDVKSRVRLLNGLMDGDGSVSKTNNRVTYSTISMKLALDVQELVECLGGIASIKKYDRTKESKPIEYSVRIRLPNGISPFTIPRKASRYSPGSHARPCRTVVSVEYVRTVESVCIAVDADDKLYVTEQCILTHNTIQAIGVINADPAIETVLIVCPKSLVINWLRELERWLVRRTTVDCATTEGWPKSKIVVVNYDILPRFEGERSSAFDLLVVDEAHYVKNPKTKRALSIFGHRGNSSKGIEPVQGVEARRKLFMTGTPICNRPIELWPIAHHIARDRFGNWKRFVERYCGGVKSGFGWDVSGASNLGELQQMLRETCMVRRLKSEVLKELPAKRRQVVELDVPGVERLLARERELEADDDRQLREAAVELAKVSDDVAQYRAAVAALNEGTSKFDEVARIAHELALAKVPQVIEFVRELIEAGEKVILFAHHLDAIDRYFHEFRASGAALVIGETVDRMSQVDRFQNDDTCRIFIGGIKPAGVGLTLTRATYVVFAELPWTPGDASQCEDRAHRIGLDHPVNVVHLVVNGSLDVRKARVIIQKQDVIAAALDVPGSFQAIEASEPARSTETTVTVTMAELAKRAPQITPERAYLALQGVRIVAQSCDGAHQRDGGGFSRFDAAIGKSLAQQSSLSQKQAVLALKLCRKYQKQIGEQMRLELGLCGTWD